MYLNGLGFRAQGGCTQVRRITEPFGSKSCSAGRWHEVPSIVWQGETGMRSIRSSDASKRRSYRSKTRLASLCAYALPLCARVTEIDHTTIINWVEELSPLTITLYKIRYTSDLFLKHCALTNAQFFIQAIHC